MHSNFIWKLFSSAIYFTLLMRNSRGRLIDNLVVVEGVMSKLSITFQKSEAFGVSFFSKITLVGTIPYERFRTRERKYFGRIIINYQDVSGNPKLLKSTSNRLRCF